MSKNSTDHIEIERLKTQLEKSLGWGKSSDWHSSMFTELSERIFEQSQVMLSAATLKRFFGVVTHDGNPSISTLDALSAFAGYKNWRDFKLSHSKRPKLLTRSIPRKSLYVSLGFVIAIFTISLLSSKRATNPRVLALIPFASQPVTNQFPNSVLFDFDLTGVQTDNLRIQQYWDHTKTVEIEKDQKQATGIYYFPGYFRAKLLIDDEIVKEHDLFLKSNGWLGTIDYEPIPKYFSPIRDGNSLKFPAELFNELRESEEPLVSTYHYVNELGAISGDNFTLNASLKNAYAEKWAVCQSVRIYILGSDGAMVYPFSKVGCSSDNNLMLNDTYLNGKEHDLSVFGTDLSSSQDVQITVLDKQVKVSINGYQVYEGAYNETMGRLVGVRFKFLGAGVVDSFILRNGSMQEVPLM